jgi:hypothetical protein
MNDFKKWYQKLYRGEKWIVNIGMIIVVVSMLLWVTHEPKERQGVKKPIVLDRR